MGHAQPVAKFDLPAFLAWEAEQSDRHEWVDGEVFAMTGARDAHNRIALNFAAALKTALRGSPCRTFMADMKLHIAAADAVVYPDVFVTCDPRNRLPDADVIKRHPSLVVEVISVSTGAYDRGRKFALYRSLPTLQEVLFVEQDRMQVDLFRRNADGRWELYPAGENDQLVLASVGLALPVAALYEDVLPGEVLPATQP
jgi:Uma2 family endonuclease